MTLTRGDLGVSDVGEAATRGRRRDLYGGSVEYMWRSLTDDDLPALVALTRRVLAADGGLPVAGHEPFLRSRYYGGASTAAFTGDDLVAAAALRTVGDQLAAIGQVDPGHRGRGLGTRLVEWATGTADTATDRAAVRFETESLTDAADALFGGHGLRRTFAEDVMARDLREDAPSTPLPDGVTLTPWSAETAPRFHAVYTAAFADRPGFPGWSAMEWIAWISDDEEFAPQWTMLARRYGADIGFIAGGTGDGATGAWVVQVGVAPAARGAGLGAGLTAEALRRMRADGQTRVLLDVNVDNPAAARVYRRLGFEVIGRRARYEA